MQIRKLQQKDAKKMLSWMHDPAINCFFATDFSGFTPERVATFISNAHEDGESVHRACVDDNDEYLGTISLKHIDLVARNAEYAISFCADAHGTGASVFATDEMLCYGFEELGLERIYLNVLADNRRADHFYQSYGFIYEGMFQKHLLIGGVLHDLKWYRLLREEWLEKMKEQQK